jgi:hypothetical protein
LIQIPTLPGDLQGNPRIGVGVTAQVFYLDGGQVINAFDNADRQLGFGAAALLAAGCRTGSRFHPGSI